MLIRLYKFSVEQARFHRISFVNILVNTVLTDPQCSPFTCLIKCYVMDKHAFSFPCSLFLLSDFLTSDATLSGLSSSSLFLSFHKKCFKSFLF